MPDHFSNIPCSVSEVTWAVGSLKSHICVHGSPAHVCTYHITTTTVVSSYITVVGWWRYYVAPQAFLCNILQPKLIVTNKHLRATSHHPAAPDNQATVGVHHIHHFTPYCITPSTVRVLTVDTTGGSLHYNQSRWLPKAAPTHTLADRT